MNATYGYLTQSIHVEKVKGGRVFCFITIEVKSLRIDISQPAQYSLLLYHVKE